MVVQRGTCGDDDQYGYEVEKVVGCDQLSHTDADNAHAEGCADGRNEIFVFFR